MRTTTILLAICLGFAARASDSTNTPAPAEPAEYNVRDFGAKGDGQTLETEAIRKALDECGRAGGGTVRFPAGTYLSKPISLRSKTTLLLEAGAILQATKEHKDFMKTPGDWLSANSSSDFVPLISGRDLTDVTVTGKGTIDGAGEVWWGPAEEARRKTSGFTLPRPNLIHLTRCKNLKVTGVTIQNSPKFHLVPEDCEDVLIEGVTILAPDGAANTDAIDPSVSRHVLITNCIIDVGDDNVAIKSGRKIPGREFACEDITVTGCVFKHGHGMSIGSETRGGVRNVLVKNCAFEGTENGLRIKSPRGRGGPVENITYTDITMTNCRPTAITITCYYPKIPKTDTNQPVTAETPKFRSIRIANVKATSQNAAGVIIGLPESLVENVVLENVQISSPTGLTIRNAEGVRLRNVAVKVERGEPFLVEDAQVEGLEQAKDK